MSCLRQRLGSGGIAMSKKRQLRTKVPMLGARPVHMSGAVETPEGSTCAACNWKVSQRNAPGAINAMALMVNPERLRVFFIWLWVRFVG